MRNPFFKKWEVYAVIKGRPVPAAKFRRRYKAEHDALIRNWLAMQAELEDKELKWEKFLVRDNLNPPQLSYYQKTDTPTFSPTGELPEKDPGSSWTWTEPSPYIAEPSQTENPGSTEDTTIIPLYT